MNRAKLVVKDIEHCRASVSDSGDSNITVTAAALFQNSLLFGTSDGRVIWKGQASSVEAKVDANPVTELVVDFRQQQHVLVLTDSRDFHVLSLDRSGRRFNVRQLRALHDETVRCATWLSTTDNDYNRKSFLVGTESGKLSLVTFKRSSNTDKIIDFLWQTPEDCAIIGVYVEQIGRNNILCAVATGAKIYHSVLTGCNTESFLEMNQAAVFAPIDGARLRQLNTKPKLSFLGRSRIPASPRTFIWATESGMLVTGELEVHLDEKVDARSLHSKVDNTLSLRNQLSLDEDVVDLAISALTIVLLSAHSMLLVSVLNGQQLKSTRLPFDTISDVARVLLRNEEEEDFLAVSAFGTAISLTIDNEDANAWKVAAEIGRFDLALQLAPTEKKIFEMQAADYEMRDDWDAAVKLYAKTNLSVEQIMLKIADACKHDLHMTFRLQSDYLGRRLDDLPERDATQRSIVILMLVELYSGKLSLLDSADQEALLKEDFCNFLSDHGNDLIARTAVEIMVSHGRYDEASFLATRLGDLRTAVHIHLRLYNVNKALDVYSAALSEGAVSARKRADALSLVAPDASTTCPMRLTKLWFNDEQNVHLDHHQLVQNLLLSAENSQARMRAEALQAAQWFLEALLDTADLDEIEERYWLNALLTIYSVTNDEKMAVELVEKNHEKLSSHNLGLILNRSLAKRMVKLSMVLYGALNLHEKAVDLALQSSDRQGAENHAIKVAKAARTASEKRHAKNLLLQIVTNQSEDFLDLVERSQGHIRVEDALSVLPVSQSDKIDSAVRSALIKSLEDHCRATTKARVASDHLLSAAEEIRNRITEATASRDVRSNKIVEQANVRYYMCGHSAGASFACDSCPICGDFVVDAVGQPIGHNMWEEFGLSKIQT